MERKQVNQNASDAVEPFSLRIPIELREQVRKRATANRRSINAEILVLVETALADTKQSEAA